MVTALANDPAVWHSVMNNRVVQELKNAFYEGSQYLLLFNTQFYQQLLSIQIMFHIFHCLNAY